MVRIAVMAIRSQYAEAIYSGAKTHEYRRARTSFGIGDQVLIYEPMPVGRITGEFVVRSVRALTNANEVVRLEREMSITKAVQDYLSGARRITALEISSPSRWAVPVQLSEISPRLRAPQSYVFLRENDGLHRHRH
jgi:predicted transcriptional regulator